jgi:hypothetical protein
MRRTCRNDYPPHPCPSPPPILDVQAPLTYAAGGEGNLPRVGDTRKTHILRMSLKKRVLSSSSFSCFRPFVLSRFVFS